MSWPRTSLLPGIFFLAGTALIMFLTVARQQFEFERIQLETQVTGEQTRLRLQSCFDDRETLVETLSAFKWENGRQLREVWPERAGILHALQSGIQALNFVDPQGIIRVVYPPGLNQVALGADLFQNSNPSVIRALTAALNSGGLERTDIIELLQSGSGFAMYKQIHSESGEFLGFVNGVFRTNDLLETCLEEYSIGDAFVFTLTDPQLGVFFRQPPLVDLIEGSFLVEGEVMVADLPWHLSFSPTAMYMERQGSWLDYFWPALGEMLVLVFALAYRALLQKQIRLQSSEDKYRLLVENQTDMVVQVDAAGCFLYVSPSYCQVFGKHESELLGQQFLPLVHEDDQQLTQESLASLLQPPHHSYHEQRAMTASGWRWLAWSNSALFDAKGELCAISAVGRDVTDIKALEMRMSHAQKMQAIGNMAGGITHDFNNLMQVMLGNIEFLLHTYSHLPVVQERLQKVCNVIESAMTLTAKLSTLSRQEPARYQIISVNTFAQDFLVLIRHTLPSSISISLQLADTPLYVSADPTQLEQVLLNICFNARDAMAKGGLLQMTVSAASFAPASADGEIRKNPDGFVCIRVKDNGSGIKPENLSRIFEPFFTTKEQGNGTGLGLANSYSIVRQHGGEILVESGPDDGTVFAVYLPRCPAEQYQQEIPEPLVDASHDQVYQSQDADMILVVDDDADILQMMSQILEAAGYRTVLASNGRQAVEKFRLMPGQFKLVVMDLIMPELGGQEAARAILEQAPNISVVFVSGYVPPAVEQLPGTLLRKPFTHKALLEYVSNALKAAAGSAKGPG